MKVNYFVFIALFYFGGCTKEVDYEGRYFNAMEKTLQMKRVSPVYKEGSYIEPAMPEYKKDIKTLEGTDANKNGMRDDLEIYIMRNTVGGPRRKLLWDQLKFYYDLSKQPYALNGNMENDYQVMESVYNLMGSHTRRDGLLFSGCAFMVLEDDFNIYPFGIIGWDIVFNSAEREKRASNVYFSIGRSVLSSGTEDEYQKHCPYARREK